MLGLASLALLTAGCRARPEPERAPAEPLLSWLPDDTHTVMAAELTALRASALWKGLASGVRARRQTGRLLDELRTRTGFDPLEDVRRVLLAFPEDAREKGRFAIVIEGRHLDERRLVAFLRDQASLHGLKVGLREQEGQRLWLTEGAGRTQAVFFPMQDTLVVTAGAWLESVEAGSALRGRGLARRTELPNLVRRVGVNHALWAVALVPAKARGQLFDDARFTAASAIARLALTVDLAEGLTADALAELSTMEHARSLADQLERFSRDARGTPSVLLWGLGPWLDSVRVKPEGPSVHAHLTLNASQTQSLAERLEALFRAP